MMNNGLMDKTDFQKLHSKIILFNKFFLSLKYLKCMFHNTQLRELREQKNYTQEYLAEKLGISQNTYSRLETGQTKVSIEKLKEIAQVLEVPLWELLEEKATFYFHNNQEIKGYIQNLYEYQKDLQDQVITTLKEEIAYLRSENAKLMGIVEKILK